MFKREHKTKAAENNNYPGLNISGNKKSHYLSSKELGKKFLCLITFTIKIDPSCHDLKIEDFDKPVKLIHSTISNNTNFICANVLQREGQEGISS